MGKNEECRFRDDPGGDGGLPEWQTPHARLARPRAPYSTAATRPSRLRMISWFSSKKGGVAVTMLTT